MEIKEIETEFVKNEEALSVWDGLSEDYSWNNVKENEFEKVKAIVVGEMENVYKMSVALEVDSNTGKTWYEAK